MKKKIRDIEVDGRQYAWIVNRVSDVTLLKVRVWQKGSKVTWVECYFLDAPLFGPVGPSMVAGLIQHAIDADETIFEYNGQQRTFSDVRDKRVVNILGSA